MTLAEKAETEPGNYQLGVGSWVVYKPDNFEAHYCETESEAAELTNSGKGWCGPITVLERSAGAAFDEQVLRHWLPRCTEWLKIAESDPAQRVWGDVVQWAHDDHFGEHPVPGVECALAEDDWQFEDISKGAVDLAHELLHKRPAKSLLEGAQVAYDLEQAFELVHQRPSARDIWNFWSSLDVARHITRACRPPVGSELLCWIRRYARDLEAGNLPRAAAVGPIDTTQGPATPEADSLKTYKLLPSTPHEQPLPLHEDTDTSSNQRKEFLRQYKAECKAVGVKVINPMIAHAADSSWNERTAVEKWAAAKDPRYNNPIVNRKIMRVLTEKPHLSARVK